MFFIIFIVIYSPFFAFLIGILKRNERTLYDAVLQNQKQSTDSECIKKEIKVHSGFNMQNSKCKYV